MVRLSFFGFIAVMLVCYALENRSPWFIPIALCICSFRWVGATASGAKPRRLGAP
jgi:hypothetical protein